MRGQGGTKAVVDAKRRSITVRLQGIDAPELHYQPQGGVPAGERSARQEAAFLKWHGDFRQRQGETAAATLGKLLGGGGEIPCTVLSRVEQPNEAFDMDGRLIGNVVVRLHGDWCQTATSPSVSAGMVASSRAARYDGNMDAEVLERITYDPAKCGGRPCVRGMRIRVTDVLDLLASGLSRAEVIEELPDLEPADIEACLRFASRRIDHPILAA